MDVPIIAPPAVVYANPVYTILVVHAVSVPIRPKIHKGHVEEYHIYGSEYLAHRDIHQVY